MEKAFKCDVCIEVLESLDKLNSHIKCQHKHVSDSKKKALKCNVCGYACTRELHLINHMRTHTGERPFKCTVIDCGVAFKLESTLKDHIKFKHSDERAFTCDFPGCLHAVKSTSDLIKHKKVHSDDRPFPCPHSGCNFRAKIKCSLSLHTANVHSESKPFSCAKCSFKTKYPASFAHHMTVHERRNKNIPCSIEGCEYKGKNRKSLKDHIRRHKTYIPCPVSGCGQYVATKKVLKNHLKLHNPSGRPFQCPLCFKHFRTLQNLQEHLAVHTNEKPFQCGLCEYEAHTRANVKNHISSVHAAIEFPFMVHLLDDRECVRCKVTLPSAEFVVHCKGHVEPVLKI